MTPVTEGEPVRTATALRGAMAEEVEEDFAKGLPRG